VARAIHHQLTTTQPNPGAAATRTGSRTAPSATRRGRRVVTVVVALACAVLLGLITVARLPHPTPSAQDPIPAAGPAAGSSRQTATVAAQPVTGNQLHQLPVVTTYATVPGAPRDPDPNQPSFVRANGTGYLLAHPDSLQPVYSHPGGPAIAAVPARQWDGPDCPASTCDTELPVIVEQPGWVQVLLPVRPNHSVGWLSLAQIVLTATPYLILVDRGHFTLTVVRGGTVVGRWPVGVGLAATPTPAGRTFILADLQIVHPTYSPVILPTGTHSDVLETYGGGPGITGIHTWTPSNAVYGRASSAGCVRVPPALLTILSTDVPVGSPVLIT